MNALLCRARGVTDADRCDASHQEDFATRPMQAIELEDREIDEEALHILFEDAISDRISALNINWHSTRSTLTNTGPLRNTSIKRALSTLVAEDTELPNYKRANLLGSGWQRSIAYVCIAFMLILIGFDLMGLLILRLH